MLSNLPKLADRNFVIGFLLPAMIAVLAALGLFSDFEPISRVCSLALRESGYKDLTLLVLATWSSAVLLLLCNRLLYRLLEGYIGPFASKERSEEKRREFERESAALEAAYEKIKKDAEGASSEASLAYYADWRSFHHRFPYKKRLVLPTRFGNVIRAFETYSLAAYGVDSIPAWPRLAGVMSKEYRALIDDSRAEVDFFVNTCFLASILAVLAALRFLADVVGLCRANGGFADVHWLFPAAALAGGAFARVAYEGAIERVQDWGDLVRAAFDLYLPALARQMGYELPNEADGPKGRVSFWTAVNSLFLYVQPLKPADWPRAISAKHSGTRSAEDAS